MIESFLNGLQAIGWPAAAAVVLTAVADLGLSSRPRRAWSFTPALCLWLLGAPGWLWAGAAVAAAVLNVALVRRYLVSAPVMGLLARLRFLPTISDTERDAIEAGTVWVDGELFSGRPDFERLLSEDYPELTPREQAFLDGPVERVCRMTEDWDVMQRLDLPPETWEYLKNERFFGMIIPEEYGGLGFSAAANSAVITKLASRSQALAISVMVPNSLGPAELLLHHGTPRQKEHYLPRLARGEEMPCFALTEPGAGSDAGALTASGVLFKGRDGEPCLRLDWNKRYITLASISTVLGLAFRLKDPDGILGRGEDLGITCALVPTDTPGVDVSRRHDPLGIPFYNCPTTGTDVVVPATAIIGGLEGAGRGWRMLMESLAAGRGISLPASSTGSLKLAARVASAHAAVRKQFGVPIGRFEGIEEPLARLAGTAYVVEAARRYTCGGLDAGAKPAVLSAMLKYCSTELTRRAVADAMDVLGGNGISRGPRNLMAPVHQGTPISITVEGANILTRTLMIFGQGAIRCHPHAREEIEAFAARDLARFDRAFWSHVVHVVAVACRALALTVSRGRLARSPVDGPSAPYVRKLLWASASFAFLADVAMALLGGSLKRREKLTGRFADVFSWLYLCTATLRRFEAEGRRVEHLPLLHWTLRDGLHRMQVAFDGIFANMRGGLAGPLLALPGVWSRLNRLSAPPDDELGSDVARALQRPGVVRHGLTDGIFLPEDPAEALGRLERAFALCTQAESILRRVRQAAREAGLGRLPADDFVPKAREAGLLTDEEAQVLRLADEARDDAIQVDSFTLEEHARSAHAAAPASEPAREPARA